MTNENKATPYYDKAHFWPNGDWCWCYELEEYGRNKSDDFLTYATKDDDHAERIASQVYKYGVKEDDV